MPWKFKKRKRYLIGWLQRTAAIGILKGACSGWPSSAHSLLLNKQKILPALLKNALSLDILVLCGQSILACSSVWALIPVFHGLPRKFGLPCQFNRIQPFPHFHQSSQRALQLYPWAFDKILNLASRGTLLTKSSSFNFIFCPSLSSTLRIYYLGNSSSFYQYMLARPCNTFGI